MVLRNWKWFVPLLVVAVLFVGYVVLALFFGMFTSSEPYKHALDLAMHDPQAINVLGPPVTAGWLVTGSIEWSGNSGVADLVVPVHGRIRKGKLYVLAQKSAGEWSYQRITLLVEDGEKIDLLHHAVVPPTEN